jgi:hypothetical protein
VDALACQLEHERLSANADQTRRVGQTQLQQAAYKQQVDAAASAHVSAPNPGHAGASSLRAFQGEDLAYMERKRAQQSQQAGWNADAAQVSAAQADARRAEAAQQHATMQAQHAYGTQAYAAHQAARSQEAQSFSASNQALASDRRDKDAADAAERSATHMRALVVDDGPQAGAHRTEFRGYTQEQLAGVQAGQAQQRCVLAPGGGCHCCTAPQLTAPRARTRPTGSRRRRRARTRQTRGVPARCTTCWCARRRTRRRRAWTRSSSSSAMRWPPPWTRSARTRRARRRRRRRCVALCLRGTRCGSALCRSTLR